MRPWPWTIDADGAGHFFATKAEAVAAVTELRARGVLSIDVGCMQINLMHHPAAFATLQEAFDPLANALYAARFLNKLFRATGDWSAAVAAYHSQTRDVGAAYEEKVLAARSSPDSASPPAVAPRSRGFVLPDWIDAAVAARREPAAVGIAAPLAEGPEPAPPSGWVERAIAAVARCPAAIEPRQPDRRWVRPRCGGMESSGNLPNFAVRDAGSAAPAAGSSLMPRIGVVAGACITICG